MALFVGRYLARIMTHPNPQLASSMTEIIAALPGFKMAVSASASGQVAFLDSLKFLQCSNCQASRVADSRLVDEVILTKGGELGACGLCHTSFAWAAWSKHTGH